ncbi:MAG: hypothetical protein R3288_00190 [Woeseiaceae bacterium]|nr:hypothetical protein [Woeseiaceae bacterium]
MSTWKSARASDRKEPSGSDPAVDTDAEQPPVRPVEITAFELEVDAETGCDPYNSTGQFCLEELKKYRNDE